MKFGILFAYWTHDWTGAYRNYLKKAKELGLDILEIAAGDLLQMTDSQLNRLKMLADAIALES